MRLLGSLLLVVGALSLVVATVVLIDAGLPEYGIEIFGVTAIVTGAALVGTLALVAGALLRRRATEAQRPPERQLEDAGPAGLAEPPARELPVSRATGAREVDRR